MSIASFDPVGIGQTLSIIAIVALVVIVGGIALFFSPWFDNGDDYELDDFDIGEDGQGRGVLLA